MARARHKHVREDLPPRAGRSRRLLKVGVPALAVLAVGGSAMAATLPETNEPAQAISAAQADAAKVKSTPVPVRVEPISRSEDRVRLKEKPPEVTDHKFATTAVNIRTEPSAKAPTAGDLRWAEKVPVSGETVGEWAEVVIDKKSRWVHDDFLADTKPKPKPKPEPEPEPEPQEAAPAQPSPVESALSMAACATSDVESGLTSNAVAVHRAVCNEFPSISDYGGVRPGDDGEHGTGHALDIMISGDAGWEVAEFVRANAGELGVSYVIYSQKIWSTDRASEGWRYMEDRGSTTANHYDHVHVSVH